MYSVNLTSFCSKLYLIYILRKGIKNLDSILKNKDLTLPKKFYIFKAMVFPVVMHGSDSWNIKKPEHLKNWCYWAVMLKTLESPLTARRSNQSILKESSPVYSLERLMMKLKLQYFGHLMQRADLLEKTLMLGRLKAGEEGNGTERDGWMVSLI